MSLSQPGGRDGVGYVTGHCMMQKQNRGEDGSVFHQTQGREELTFFTICMIPIITISSKLKKGMIYIHII